MFAPILGFDIPIQGISNEKGIRLKSETVPATVSLH